MKNITKPIKLFFSSKAYFYLLLVVIFFIIFKLLVVRDSVSLMSLIILILVSTFFSNNVSTILLISIILYFIITPLVKKNTFEGMENNTTNDKIQKYKSSSKNHQTNKKQPNEDINTEYGINDLTDDTEDTTEVVGATESMSNSKSKKNSNGKVTSNNNALRLDKGKQTLENYKNLNNMVGSGGISKLTDDTKQLMHEQKKLFESIQSMTPLLGQARTLMDSFNINDINSMVKNASGIINKSKSMQQ